MVDEALGHDYDADWWRDYLLEHPDVMNRMLGDLYQVATNSKERPSTLEDLWDAVAPKFSNESFGDSVRTLLNGRSIRSLAVQVGLSHAQLVRHLTGEAPIVRVHDPVTSMRRIEQIARALRVHPSYFLDWRRLWILAAIDGAMSERPNLSIGIYQKYAQHEAPRISNARSEGVR